MFCAARGGLLKGVFDRGTAAAKQGLTKAQQKPNKRCMGVVVVVVVVVVWVWVVVVMQGTEERSWPLSAVDIVILFRR